MAQSKATRDTAKCFVPELLVDLIDRNVLSGKEGLEPCSFFVNGVCLLVDISGFTKLSGDFCDMGKAGIDELQLATNGYMGKLVETIYMFGGEIIKFAGDAIICLFSSNFITGVSAIDKMGSKLRCTRSSSTNLLFGDEKSFVQKEKGSADLPTVTTAVILRAMHCASVLKDIQTEKLTVHVAMSCGEMCFGILGGVENRWKSLISGPCIHELSDCLDDAPSKTAVISAQCGQILSQSTTERILEESDGQGSARVATFQADPATKYEFELLQLPSGNHRIVSVNCTVNVEPVSGKQVQENAAELEDERQREKALNLIRQFVPIPVSEAIENGQGLQFIAEIREVTTMFMKVSFDGSCCLWSLFSPYSLLC
jgi:class 3 adenylate cyclase